MAAIPPQTLLTESTCYACFAPGDVPSLAWLALLDRVSQGGIQREIEFSLLGTSKSNTFASSVQINIAPEPNCLLLFFWCASQESETPAATVTGLGLTWVLVASVTDGNGISSRTEIYRAMAAAPVAPGLVAATFTNPLVADECIGSCVQFKNVDTSGANGAGAIVQIVTNQNAASANPSLNLAAVNPDGRNATVAFSINPMDPYNGVAEVGWTEDYDDGCANINPDGMFVSHKLLSLDNTVSITAAVAAWWLCGMEIKHE